MFVRQRADRSSHFIRIPSSGCVTEFRKASAAGTCVVSTRYFARASLWVSRAPDMATSIGFDANHSLALRERTESAIQCAEDAAHHGAVFMISDAPQGEDRSWRLQFSSELERAIQKREITVAFQPKLSLETARIMGAEALLRWNHPERGPIEPSLVIAYAEEHDRIEMITNFVLDKALREAGRAIAIQPDFTVAVNISALDLRDPGFALQVWKSVGERPAFPRAIWFSRLRKPHRSETTESSPKFFRN